MRDPDRIVYFRPKDGGLLVGGYARDPITEPLEDPLRAARARLYEEDRARFAESWAGAQALLPVLRGSEPARFICGPEAFTPDGEFVLGETEVDGLWVAAGFCVHGLAGAGGVGRIIAEWITSGEPEEDVSGMDIRRFGPQYRSRAVRAHAGARRLLALLRHRLSRRGAARRQAAAHLARLPALAGARRSVLGEVRLGARGLVCVKRRPRGDAAGRLGRTVLVAGDPRRVSGHPRPRRTVRSDLVRQADAAGPRRAGVARAGLCQPDRPSRRHRRLHADAQRSRGDRGRRDRHPDRRGGVPAGHRHRLAAPRPGVDPPPSAGRGARAHRRHHRDRGLLLPVGAGRRRRSWGRCATTRRRSSRSASCARHE